MEPSPFDFADADAVLRTSDGILLKVHTLILKHASPFFSDLFSLPLPASKDTEPASVDISESGKVMHALLMLVYPMEHPQIDSLSLLTDVLCAAQKYDMVHAMQSLRRLLVSSQFLQSQPLLVYAVACRHNLEAEMKVASKESLRINLVTAPLAEELKYMTAYDYHRLLNLRHTRCTEAQKVLQRRTIRDHPWPCSTCGDAPQWWDLFLERAKAELLGAPTTDIIFSFPFLALISSRIVCTDCAKSLLRSQLHLAQLKASIDALPATI